MKLSDALLWVEEEDKNIDDVEEIDICMITKQSIIHKMTLKCGHSFEYSALYQNYMKNQIRYKRHVCPYCRQSFPQFIPYNENALSFKPSSYTLFTNDYLKCQYIYKSGKKKGCMCSKNAHIFKNGVYCSQHKKKSEQKETQKTYKICKQTLRNGNPCKCFVYDIESCLCKRHYNLKDKKLKISSH